MTKQEWVLLAGFVGAVWAVSYASPEAAALLAGFVGVMAFVRGNVTGRIIGKGA